MIGLRFFPLKSADVPGEGTLDARLRMSAGDQANKKVNSATKIIHIVRVSVPQVRDNACLPVHIVL